MSWNHAAAFTSDTLYLNTASMGLPPFVTREALEYDLERWATGGAQPADYDAAVARARDRFARLVHVSPRDVAVGHQVSPLVGLIAAAVPDDAEILVAAGEFTSVTFPFAAQAHRGVTVREVPLTDLPSAIGDETAWVAVAAVQSADGRRADLDAIVTEAQRHDAKTLVDLTQSAGWLDLDAGRFDATVCGGYKWLLSPRGTAFLTVRPEIAETLTPLAANWFAGEDAWNSIYGLPLRLAADARRFDVSPAWASWIGTEASLGFLLGIGVPALEAHAMNVSRAFAEAAGLPEPESPIQTLRPRPGLQGQVAVTLRHHRAATAHRAGRIRVSFHVHNTPEEVRPLAQALRDLVSP